MEFVKLDICTIMDPSTVPDETISKLVREVEESLQDNEEYQKLREIVGTRDKLSRFLIARQLNVEKTTELIVNHLQWRKENNADKIRELMLNKPFLTGSFPHSDELRSLGFGMMHTAVDAGKSRTGEVVVIEVLGAEGQSDNISEEDMVLVDKLTEHYIGFFEKRALVLEQCSKEQSRLVCSFQIRDVSKLSFMPRAGAFTVLQRIIAVGMNNYPESSSTVLLLSPSTIFSGIFAIVKRWLPEEVSRKFKTVAKQDVPMEILKYVRPSVLVALQDMHAGKHGDDVCRELNGDAQFTAEKGEKKMEIAVAARDFHYLYYKLGDDGYTSVTWQRLNAEESPNSTVVAKIFYVENGTESKSANEVKIKTVAIPGTSATLPQVEGVREALLCLSLDHTSAWFQPHTFKLSITCK